MPRFARMPHVYYDEKKRRFFVERRITDKQVQHALGRTKWKKTFPQSVDRETANKLSLGVCAGWDEQEAPHRIVRKVRVYLPGRVFSEAEIRVRVLAMIQAHSQCRESILAAYGPRTIEWPANDPALVRDESTGQYNFSEPVKHDATESVVRSDAAKHPPQADIIAFREKPAQAAVVVTIDDAITDWKRNRKDRAPGPKAIRNAARSINRLFDFLGGEPDVARVTTDDVERFKEHLMAKAEDCEGAASPYDTIVNARAVYNALPHRKLPKGNPFDGVKNPPRRQKRRRAMFTDPERAAILDKSEGQSPVIRITTLVAAHTGSHTAEVVEGHTDDIEVRADKIVVFHIRETNRVGNERLKTAERVRSLPLHPRIADEVVAYRDRIVAEYGPGPLFPMVKVDQDGRRNTSASAEIMAWLRSEAGPNIQNGPKVIRDFYCWRKTIRTILLNAKVDPDRARYIVGHAPGDVDAKNYQVHPVEELIESIGCINDPLEGR